VDRLEVPTLRLRPPLSAGEGGGMTTIGIALGVFALICVLLPCRYDPAIRLREWLTEDPDDD
jgi:hypothetical protein